ncbi:hypothetical protein BB560_007032 [Smittium megazygosporum]|uniref:V-type proton ATPase subunit C n=1 Tax=Smittium megazygosporum TaxID=133381 RepID=A0A2T9XZE1_9FUNG|nr:hypothetical protein BB560_007032 [Smittium megazygosporum]
MPLYWFISVPAEGDSTVTFNELKKIAVIPAISRLKIPDLKVGSLDTLVNASEELSKIDSLYELELLKFAETNIKLAGLTEDQYSEYFSVDNHDIQSYIANFNWDSTEYKPSELITETITKISAEVNSIQSTLKTKLAQYNVLKSSVNAEARKKQGNLSVRSLDDIIKPEHCIQGSEFLQTVFVAVPINLEKNWTNSYESLTQMVVPRSTKKIANDNEYSLYSVVMFSRVVSDFKTAAKEKKFILRDFSLSANLEEDTAAINQKIQEEQDALVLLVEWLQLSFSDFFKAWMHIRILRIFVESVLRYGLPPDFVTCVLQVSERDKDQVKARLNKAYSYLDQSGRIFSLGKTTGSKHSLSKVNDTNDAFDMNEFHSVLGGYNPFVIFEFNWAFD